MKFRYITGLGLIGLFSSLFACASHEYSATPIVATVVDAETKQPIVDALVIARWVAVGGGGMHSAHDVGSVEILETVTNSNGKFEFLGWGPKRYEGDGALMDEEPKILVFKRGYWPAIVANGQYSGPPTKDFHTHKTGPVRTSMWSGETIAMKPFKQGYMEFHSFVYYPFVESHLRHMFMSPSTTPCDWKKIPKTVAYMENERNALIAKGANTHTMASILVDLISNNDNFVSKGCGSPREYFRELGR